MTKSRLLILFLSWLWFFALVTMITFQSVQANPEPRTNLPVSLDAALSKAASRDKAIVASQGNLIDKPRRGGFHHLKTTIISIVARYPELLEPAINKAVKLAPEQKEAIIKRVAISFPEFFSKHEKPSIDATIIKQSYYKKQIRNTEAEQIYTVKKSIVFREKEKNLWPQLPSEGGPDGYANIDPLESLNRAFFYGNGALDFVLFEPLAKTYGFFVPDTAKPAIARAFNNLGEPLIFVNDIIQLEFRNAATSFSRFVINSTVGLAGFFDVAENLGLPSHKSDFGKTLHNYGVGEGIYLVLPFFGPTSVRDSIGLGVNMFIDPRSWTLSSGSRFGLSLGEGITVRERMIDSIDYLVEHSKDPYESVRAWTWQKRQQELKN